MKTLKLSSFFFLLFCVLFSAQGKKQKPLKQVDVVIAKPSKTKTSTVKYTPKFDYYFLFSEIDGGCSHYVSNIFKVNQGQPFEARNQEVIKKAEKFWAIVKPLKAKEGRCETETNSEEYLDMKVKVWRYVNYFTEWDVNLNNLQNKFTSESDGSVLINID